MAKVNSQPGRRPWNQRDPPQRGVAGRKPHPVSASWLMSGYSFGGVEQRPALGVASVVRVRALVAGRYARSTADRKSRWGSALTTWAVWTAILRAEATPLPTTSARSHPCEPPGQTVSPATPDPQEHSLIRTDCSTSTERSENDRPATRAETDADRQRWTGGGDRDAPDAAEAPGCLDRADLCQLWPAPARTVLCRLTRRRTF
jgi:hypothetical protein